MGWEIIIISLFTLLFSPARSEDTPSDTVVQYQLFAPESSINYFQVTSVIPKFPSGDYTKFVWPGIEQGGNSVLRTQIRASPSDGSNSATWWLDGGYYVWAVDGGKTDYRYLGGKESLPLYEKDKVMSTYSRDGEQWSITIDVVRASSDNADEPHYVNYTFNPASPDANDATVKGRTDIFNQFSTAVEIKGTGDFNFGPIQWSGITIRADGGQIPEDTHEDWCKNPKVENPTQYKVHLGTAASSSLSSGSQCVVDSISIDPKA